MAAFAGDRDPGAARVDQRAGAEAGARPDDQAGPLGQGGAAPDLVEVGRAEVGKREGERLEVVEENRVGETEAGDQPLRLDDPVAIGQLHRVAGDRPGEREQRRARAELGST